MDLDAATCHMAAQTAREKEETGFLTYPPPPPPFLFNLFSYFFLVLFCACPISLQETETTATQARELAEVKHDKNSKLLDLR